MSTDTQESHDSGDAKPPPRHVAIIMDGNGRWAKARDLPRTMGHRQGAEAVRQTVKGALEQGIVYITLFGFSSENWSRPENEISDLMKLLVRYLRSEVADLHKNNVRFRVIGDRTAFSDEIRSLIIALNYGGRSDITQAVRNLVSNAMDGNIKPDEITEEYFSDCLYTKDIPDPDVLIRTSGEQRISNFLLWQCAYTEFVFLETLWPDFSKNDLEQAVNEFNRRDRRFGNSGA
jgi:undecaprenyl diphosphate synthase